MIHQLMDTFAHDAATREFHRKADWMTASGERVMLTHAEIIALVERGMAEGKARAESRLTAEFRVLEYERGRWTPWPYRSALAARNAAAMALDSTPTRIESRRVSAWTPLEDS